jgi:hypothetical protein
MLKTANLKYHVQLRLWAEAVNTATKIGNISIFPGEIKSPYKKLYNTPPKLTPKHLVEFGRIGYVTDRTKITIKSKMRSNRLIMVGYADDHSPDTYRMYDPDTKMIKSTRDIV